MAANWLQFANRCGSTRKEGAAVVAGAQRKSEQGVRERRGAPACKFLCFFFRGPRLAARLAAAAAAVGLIPTLAIAVCRLERPAGGTRAQRKPLAVVLGGGAAAAAAAAVRAHAFELRLESKFSLSRARRARYRLSTRARRGYHTRTRKFSLQT